MGGAEVDAKSCMIFLKAAETGSITKAALALGYTQAGVSLVVRKIACARSRRSAAFIC